MYSYPFAPRLPDEPTARRRSTAGLDPFRPMFGMLMTEDFCWQMTLREWRTRRPSWRRRAERAARRAAGAVIEQKREGLRLLAVEPGLVIGSG